MINKLYKAKYFPLVFQIAALVVFILLIVGGIGIGTDDPAIAKQLRNTNLSNLIVWSYWWPLIILSAVLFGRHWCTICPVELIAAIAAKFGLKRKAPAFLKSGWLMTILYALIAVIAIHTWAIHRQPLRMAWYLIALMALAFVVSLIFEKRAFCSYFCPVGKLLGLYSLMARWGIRVKVPDTCSSCKTKECIAADRHYNMLDRSCTSNLYPAKIEDNRECILCTQCIKACPHDNIELKKVSRPASTNLSTAEIGMITILMGFASYEILSSWKVSKLVLLAPVKSLYASDIFSTLPEGTFKAILLFIIFPAITISIVSLLNSISGKDRFMTSLKSVVLAVLPVIAFAHVFKALIKTVSRIPYWEMAISDPNGVHYANEIVNKAIILPKYEILNTVVMIIGVVLLTVGLDMSLKKLWRSPSPGTTKTIISILVLAYWAFLQLGPFSGFFQ